MAYHLKNTFTYSFNGIKNITSSDPPYKNDNARFTTVPLKALYDQV